MAKITSKYETIFIVDLDLGEEGIANMVAKFRTLIEENATLEKVDEWGKRRYAYPINDQTEGYYVLVNFESKPDFPAELDRIYKITEGIVRSIIVCKDEK